MFLALAAGLVLGTTALDRPVLQGLRQDNVGLAAQTRALQSDSRALQEELATVDALVRDRAAALVGGTLSGQRVLLVLAPGADPQSAEQLGAVIGQAGGTVSGRLVLQPKLLDPASGQLVQDLVASVVPAGVKLTGESATARAGAELGAALLAKSGNGIARDAAQQVVSAFKEAGLADVTGAGTGLPTGTLAVVLTGPAPDRADAGSRRSTDNLLALATELRARANGVVVAGPAAAAADGGALATLRQDAARNGVLSSVDGVDRAAGQVAVALALKEQMQGGVGRYGGGPGASGPAPATKP